MKLQQFDAFFKALPAWKLSIVGLLSVGMVGLLDQMTGYEMSFSIFYLLPITLHSWYGGRRQAFALCLVSAGIWLLVDSTAGHLYRHGWILYWNAAVRLAFFLVTTRLVIAVKAQMVRENELARIDVLTGVKNSRGFREEVRLLLRLAARQKGSVAMGYIDLDNFKTVNDRFGHAKGDQVLQSVGRILAGSARASDIVGRLGGDEFAVLLPDTDQSGAQEYFKRLHAALSNDMRQKDWPVGFSIGVAIFEGGDLDENSALQYADSLMYRVKNKGKNSIFIETVTKKEPTSEPLPSIG